MNRTGKVVGNPTDDYAKVRWADLNGDGSLDLLAQDTQNNNLRSYLATPRVFGRTGIPFVSSADPDLTRWANFRQLGPGWMDFAYTDGFLTYTFYNQYSDLTLYSTFGAFNAADMDWGDFDADGDLDLLMVRTSGQDVIRRNDGGGIFLPPMNIGPAGDQSTASAWGDFNNNGYLDAVIANNSDILYYEYNAATSAFPTAPSYIIANQNANITDIEVADFNNDGNLDIFAASDSFTWGGSVYLGDG